MDIDKIKAFLVLAKVKKFSLAAEELYISQPALSKQIQALERDLKVPLFNRTKKSTSLTVYGEYFLGYAHNILANYSNAREDINEIENLERGTLRFGATNFIGVYMIPELLAKFNKLYPGVRLNMSINSSKNIMSMLASYQLEFVLLSDYIQTDEERFTSKPWRQDKLKVIVGKNSKFFTRHTVRLEELNEEVFITKTPDSSLYKFLLRQLSVYGLTIKHPLFISQQEAIKQAVIHNLGVSIMSPLAVELEEKMGLLKTLNIVGHPLTREINVVYEKSWHLTPAAREFFKLLSIDI
jgi:DNA-binding transcriptional LysR family regulator